MQRSENSLDTLEAKRIALVNEKNVVDDRLRSLRASVSKAKADYKCTGRSKTTLRWFSQSKAEIDRCSKRSQEIQAELAKIKVEIKSINRAVGAVDGVLWKIAHAVDRGDVNVFDYLSELDVVTPGWRAVR